MTSGAIVEARRISRVFEMPAGPVTAVHDVSLRIGAGDHVAVRGPSGCGKSTLLHILGCVETPTSGTLLFDGCDVAGLSDAARAALRLRHIGFIFQRFFLLPMLTAWENVELPLAEAGGEHGCADGVCGQRAERQPADHRCTSTLSLPARSARRASSGRGGIARPAPRRA
ncbi:MAG TPA: ATP-binding cassette domain-containing protein [Vicinamibacterales bacterium]|nr:ATP-binding cassette domain-containing protein [Vicinamibacterales bacterium]